MPAEPAGPCEGPVAPAGPVGPGRPRRPRRTRRTCRSRRTGGSGRACWTSRPWCTRRPGRALRRRSGPVGPVGPGSPVSPFAPVAPVTPVIPWDPAGPTGPAGPVSPGGPAEPTGPAGPVAPGLPSPVGSAYRARRRRCPVARSGRLCSREIRRSARRRSAAATAPDRPTAPATAITSAPRSRDSSRPLRGERESAFGPNDCPAARSLRPPCPGTTEAAACARELTRGVPCRFGATRIARCRFPSLLPPSFRCSRAAALSWRSGWRCGRGSGRRTCSSSRESLRGRARRCGPVGSRLTAFVVYCAASSAAYLLNDLMDARADRLHPVKRRRPSLAASCPPGRRWPSRRCSARQRCSARVLGSDRARLLSRVSRAPGRLHVPPEAPRAHRRDDDLRPLRRSRRRGGRCRRCSDLAVAARLHGPARALPRARQAPQRARAGRRRSDAGPAGARGLLAAARRPARRHRGRRRPSISYAIYALSRTRRRRWRRRFRSSSSGSFATCSCSIAPAGEEPENVLMTDAPILVTVAAGRRPVRRSSRWASARGGAGAESGTLPTLSPLEPLEPAVHALPARRDEVDEQRESSMRA